MRLEYFTVLWNALEAAIGLAAGIAAGSVALVGFALDSIAEGSSGGILLWRLNAEAHGGRTVEDVEQKAIRLVAVAFLGLSLYVGVRSAYDLFSGARPDDSPIGIAIAIVSLIVMPILARRKKALAKELNSRALQADSTQTTLCTYLSAILLVGLVTNAAFGWWWGDPLAGLCIALLAAKEGRELWRTKDLCCI